MTPEEHNLLIENNILLKQILAKLNQQESAANNIKDFVMNVIANIISNNNQI